MHDYIVIGGGSAGCALTGRLIEAGASVLLIEAGPRDTHPLIHIPAGFTRLLSSPCCLAMRHRRRRPWTDANAFFPKAAYWAAAVR